MIQPVVFVFVLASITRYDVTIEESGFESCLQLQTQWAIYLTLQIVVVADGFAEHTSFQFQVILFKIQIRNTCPAISDPVTVWIAVFMVTYNGPVKSRHNFFYI